MSEVTLDRIKTEHARVAALIEQYEKQTAITTVVIPRTEIPVPAGARLVGAAINAEGKVDYWLILHADESKGGHDEALAYAASRGLDLPDNRDGRLLQAAFPEFCAEGSMWLKDKYKGDSAYAWSQYSSSGFQSITHKSAALRAVVVSRFIPSVI